MFYVIFNYNEIVSGKIAQFHLNNDLSIKDSNTRPKKSSSSFGKKIQSLSANLLIYIQWDIHLLIQEKTTLTIQYNSNL